MMGSIGLYLTLENDEELAQCLALIRPLANGVILLDENDEKKENRAFRSRQFFKQLSGKNIDDEGLQLLLGCVGDVPPSLQGCIKLGEYFYKRRAWKQAIFWFENALRMEGDKSSFICLRLGTSYGELCQLKMAATYMKLAELMENQDRKEY